MEPKYPPSARPEPATGHPPELIEAERPYIIRWGKREALIAAAATAGAAAAIGAGAALVSPLVLLLLVPILPAGALGVLFFRNPRRTCPADPGLFISPADGTVTDVGTEDEPEYIGGPARKVGIFLSIFSVHLNRAPCSGRIELLRHRDGQHLDARDPRCGSENESQAIGLARTEEGGAPGAKVLVRQVSGAIARRIVCPLREGQPVERGRLVGMIKYGSRTELYVAARPGDPPLEALVKPGDKVRAGETVLLRYRASN